MELHLDFKIIAAKNPAKELIELNKKFLIAARLPRDITGKLCSTVSTSSHGL